MPIALAVDVGTTTITALALNTDDGAALARETLANDAETTSPEDKARGRSEWDAARIAQQACAALRGVADRLGPRVGDACGLGITGQQHGVVLLDAQRAPLTPLVNWQDRRGEEPAPGGETWVRRAARLLGPDAERRAGCRLATGFMGVTLYWMRETDALPAGATACFAPDYVGAVLTGERPVCDPTNGASSGLFDLERRTWDDGMIRALGLPRTLFPTVRETGERLGVLSASAASMTGLPEGLPVFVALGDHQASFLGSVASPEDTVLVNVGTGAQVARYTGRFHYAPPLETRPFPRRGYLLVQPGLSGGRSYALLERFFRQVGREVLGAETEGRLYARMNALAAQAPPGADGLRCEPFFAGSRAEPARRAAWTGMSEANFKPAHMTRALLEGMARSWQEAYMRIQAVTGEGCARLAGAGNGLRENRVLADLVAEAFAIPLSLPFHGEEAACGAALTAGVGAGLWPDFTTAGRQVRYGEPAGPGGEDR